jgi:hypothetical protein
MSRRFVALALACCWLAVVSTVAGRASAALLPPLFEDPKPQPSLTFVYHGWRVDASRTAHIQKPAKMVKAIKAQIDLIERLNLPKTTIAFMRSVPIAAAPGPVDERGSYARGRGVVINSRGLDDKRPVLLDQMLYAYQDQVLPAGVGNPDVARLRREAIDKHVWPKTATMLRSDPDYFVMVASAYLYGAITREPYTRADLRKTQPDAYQWLASLFDGGVGRR